MEFITLQQDTELDILDIIDTISTTQRCLNRYSKYESLKSSNYELDGFVHICDVCKDTSSSSKWRYKNINKSLMFSDHKSWVYILVVGGIVFKIGESGNPLGWRSASWKDHPQSSTKGRLSRYMGGDGTDEDIRLSLSIFLYEHTVSFWAKKCDIIDHPTVLLGNPGTVCGSVHKDLEMRYLDIVFNEVGCYPYLNKSRK